MTFTATRLCHLCSYRSIELKQFGTTRKGLLNTRTFQATNSGLTCTSCNAFVCLDCVKLLTPLIENDAKDHVDSYLLDSFHHALRSKGKTNCSPKNYIGHCCALSRPRHDNVTPSSAPSKKVTTKCFSVPSTIAPSKSTPASSKTAAPPESPPITPRLSGCIHFPEFDLFVDSPMDCMDIHAVGAESKFIVKNKLKRNKSGNLKPPAAEIYLPARWHRVVSHTFAASIDDKAPKANGPQPESWNSTILRNVKVKQPHCVESKKVSNYLIIKIPINNAMVAHYYSCLQYNIRIITIQKKNCITTKNRASNMPSATELEQGYLFSGAGPFKVPDVTFILGTDVDGSYASILLCRFHKFVPNLTSTQKRHLFQDAWNSLGANKFECRRSGGSSGFITESVDNVILKFMNYSGSTPRNGKGAVWIKGSETWFIYYIGTYDGDPKRCKYTNPVPGGSFLLKSKYLKAHPILNEFISIKPISALIISTIQPILLKKENFKFLITPQAVSEETRNIAETTDIISAFKSGTELPLDLDPVPKGFRGNSFKMFYDIYNKNFIKYTIVMHPVGLHRDTFADGTPSLENKVCFKLLSTMVPEAMLLNTHQHGRGGGCSNEFVFALLDWSSGQRSRRRVWTHPANARLPNAPANNTQRLTIEIWRAFFRRGAVFVPDGVNANNL